LKDMEKWVNEECKWKGIVNNYKSFEGHGKMG
jgi:hypothetical protein